MPIRPRSLMSLCLLAWLGSCPTMAQTSPLVPSETNYLAHPDEDKRLLSDLENERGKPCNVLFMGASNVERWQSVGEAVWKQYFNPWHALDLAVTGDRTQDVLWRIDHLPLEDIHPKAVVLFVGLNNASDRPCDIAGGIMEITRKLQSDFPGVRIILTSLTPSVRGEEFALQTNRLLQQNADGTTIIYDDLYSKLPPTGHGWEGLGPDGVHLDQEGYIIWARTLEPVLNRVLGVQPTQKT